MNIKSIANPSQIYTFLNLTRHNFQLSPPYFIPISIPLLRNNFPKKLTTPRTLILISIPSQIATSPKFSTTPPSSSCNSAFEPYLLASVRESATPPRPSVLQLHRPMLHTSTRRALSTLISRAPEGLYTKMGEINETAETKKAAPSPSPVKNTKFIQSNIRILVMGGAGFIGSHLVVDKLMENERNETYRNNLNKILATAYIKNEPWKMGVHKRKGVVYLDVHTLPERPQTELDRRRCYWGYAFENLATENSTEIDGDGRGTDANVEFCSVIKTKLGAHRIIMGAEMDCCDAHDDGRKFYIELKTSRELDYRTEERFEREKLLKFWIQSFIAGVPYIVIGFRDDAGMLVRTERLRTKDITQRVKMKGYWQGGVCLAFADEVLCWLYGTVKENEDYILQFAHPFQRLELLKAQSCPDAITQHVDQLQII